MKFWQEKLPNFIYDINYEKLTENKEDEVKKLLRFCELNWEEDCLNLQTENQCNELGIFDRKRNRRKKTGGSIIY